MMDVVLLLLLLLLKQGHHGRGGPAPDFQMKILLNRGGLESKRILNVEGDCS